MRVIAFIGFLTISLASTAGGEQGDRQKYIEQWNEIAVEQMYAHGIPASITLAQGILESGNGKSMLSKQANNHFGIKCHGWNGPGVFKDDDRKDECFRKYNSPEDSFEDHSEFLKKSRYQFLYDLSIKDYKAWAKGLKKAGYATDPSYAKRLIDIIEDNELYKYDEELLRTAENVKQEAKPRYSQERTVNPTDRQVIDLRQHREILIHPNSIKFVKARLGDDIELLAEDLNMAPWQLSRYNDLPGHHRFVGGETVYLQPKRNRSTSDYHLSIQGETLRVISQRYGVKLKRLTQYNGIDSDSPLDKGTKVLLRKPSRR